MDFVSVMMGSKSDYALMQECLKVLEDFGVRYEVLVASAHRSLERVHQYVSDAEKKGAKVFIAAAGMAAHLAGGIAAITTKPVIGVPMPGGALDGLDALLSTVQMPSGMPVATVAIGKAGAMNAAYLAVQILAIYDSKLAQKLVAQRQDGLKKIESDSKQIEKFL